MDKEGCDEIKKIVFVLLCIVALIVCGCNKANTVIKKNGVILVETTDIKDVGTIKIYDEMKSCRVSAEDIIEASDNTDKELLSKENSDLSGKDLNEDDDFEE